MSDRPRIRVCAVADVEPGTAKRIDIDNLSLIHI